MTFHSWFHERLWGRVIILNYLNENGKKKKLIIGEEYYEVETIKKLIEEILKINSNIKVNKQYLDLINGKYDSDLNKFKLLKVVKNKE